MEKKTQWYLMPRDTHTKNKIIQGLLDSGEMIDPSNPTDKVRVKGGEKLEMISVPKYIFIAYAERSAADSGYDLVPYVCEGNSPARTWKLDQRKKTERNKAVREMKKQLSELKGRSAKKR